MHELSIARELVRLIEAEARRAGARRVRSARVVLGARSHVFFFFRPRSCSFT